MTEATTLFVEDHDDDQEGEGPSEAVAEVLALAYERGADLIELALFSIGTTAGQLAEDLDAETCECGTVAALERLQIASNILADIDFGDGPEEGEGEGEEGEDLAQAA